MTNIVFLDTESPEGRELSALVKKDIQEAKDEMTKAGLTSFEGVIRMEDGTYRSMDEND